MTEQMSEKFPLLFRLQELKKVARQNHVNGRPENPAEHSWGVAMLAVLFHDLVPDVDLAKALKMSVVHDTCEIGIGDVCHYDVKDHEARSRLEYANVSNLFRNNNDICTLWEEFEASETLEARYVQSLDKIEPVIQNITEKGLSWKRHRRSKSTVLNYKLQFVLPELRSLLIELVDIAVELGYLLDE